MPETMPGRSRHGVAHVSSLLFSHPTPNWRWTVSAELLRKAAKVLREHAEAATPGPWVHVDYSDGPSVDITHMGCGSVLTLGENVAGGDIAAPKGDLYPRSGYSPKGDMALIALLGPPVALALAELLDELAAYELPVESTAIPVARAALDLAAAILRESP
jgi:hypothetical protein